MSASWRRAPALRFSATAHLSCATCSCARWNSNYLAEYSVVYDKSHGLPQICELPNTKPLAENDPPLDSAHTNTPAPQCAAVRQ
jgi:hypothetical protein